MTTDAPTAEPGTKVARPAAIVRYLRTHPFSVALSLVLLGTGVGFGTLWGNVPFDLAASPLTTIDAGAWWTPLTALLVPDSAVEAVLTIALILTVMAYAERMLGTVRSILAFVVTGVLGVLIGIGVEALLSSGDLLWGLTLESGFVLDPAAGVVGVIMAGSAFAPALFRRRIRIIGFAVILMFTLYAGDADSLYRLVSAVLGIVLGLILARDVPHAAWHRSSYGETRTIVAAMVAVTGLGPLIVLLSGVANGPLALVVAGFQGVDANEIFDRCAAEFTDRCTSDVARALTDGPGPFLLSLMPLLLSLIAAWGLRVGRHAAWILAIAVNAAIGVVTAVSLGAGELFNVETVQAIGVEYVIWAVVAVLVPVSVIVLLVITRHRFRVRAPRAAVLRFALIVGAAFVILAGAYVLIVMLSPDDVFLIPVEPGDDLLDALRRFLPAGLLQPVPTPVAPLEGVALFAHQWVGVIFWVVFIIAMLMLYRATIVHRNPESEARFRELLRTGGGGTLGFMGTWPGNDYWFSADGTGAIAYRVINGVALTMSDPVCADEHAAATIRGFVDHCDSQGWTPVFYSFHEKHLPVFQGFGWQYMSVGEETVIPLSNFELAGKPWAKVRQAYNKGEREGITTLWSTWDDLPASIAADISAISEQWVSEKELPEMGFTLGGMEELKDPEVALYLAFGKDGGLQAITSWLPSWSDGKVTGWTIDFMRRGDESTSGIMEFVIASAAFRMKEQGVEVMSLSGAPLAEKPLAPGEAAPDPTVMTRLLSWLGKVLEPAYGFTSLFRFKSKFNPEYQTIYMAYADPAQLATIGLAIGNAYLPEVSPKEYIALVKTLT
ncbi:lysylphosphatidylglycerol synthetase-like protein (DUF2156 family) [Microbacterium resistens]|uniref:Lysylphosphatidylglycerol synthetase-like protein (DUF2156 family) n=1 Tax=Microbacterium resistens TaxID=156977 RepID=A0ABU1SCE8_9MICO|nr:DUF2156 domain-containing protein [Microbacterium resistens]MDR6867229.1 lysylphosphatidylglycerol synthetase-like protein (DUF2156 family) [Microbacterium resistens]